MNTERYKWVDVSKALAMIFVYLGHWNTVHLEAFAYGFHLQLFFIVSGFFAVKTSQRDVKEWILKQIKTLIVPYLLWVIISFVYNNLDNTEIIPKDLCNILLNPSTMQPNYWFFSAIIGVIVCYFLLYRIIKKPILILIFSLILHMLYGETPLISNTYNIFCYIGKGPYGLQIFNKWISLSGIPQYLFWYSLGAVIFEKIKQYIETKNSKSVVFYSVGVITGIISVLLYFSNVTEVLGLQNILYINNAILESYKIICSIIIILFVFFISKIIENSKIMNNIGKSSMNFMGLEFITHSYFTLSFLPMINLGIPTINSTLHIVTIEIIQIAINLWISNRINKYAPVLNGGWK